MAMVVKEEQGKGQGQAGTEAEADHSFLFQYLLQTINSNY